MLSTGSMLFYFWCERFCWINNTRGYFFKQTLVSTYDKHCVKSVRIRSYSGLYFPAFGLNRERYRVSLRIQSECGKLRTRITPNTGTFYTVKWNLHRFIILIKLTILSRALDIFTLQLFWFLQTFSCDSSLFFVLK